MRLSILGLHALSKEDSTRGVPESRSYFSMLACSKRGLPVSSLTTQTRPLSSTPPLSNTDEELIPTVALDETRAARYATTSNHAARMEAVVRDG